MPVDSVVVGTLENRVPNKFCNITEFGLSIAKKRSDKKGKYFASI
jgi:hypothetical protein